MVVKVQYFLTHFCLNVILVSYCDNSLTMKRESIFLISDFLPIHHEIHVFKIIYSPYNMILTYIKMNLMQNWSH
jgi:hypothetical protein